MALAINFIYKVLKRLYIIKKRKIVSEYEALSQDKWKNTYPIIIVHGFAGFMPDESYFLGNYFSQISDPLVSGHNHIY